MYRIGRSGNVERLGLGEDRANGVDANDDARGELLLELTSDAGDRATSARTDHYHVHLRRINKNPY